MKQPNPYGIIAFQMFCRIVFWAFVAIIVLIMADAFLSEIIRFGFLEIGE